MRGGVKTGVSDVRLLGERVIVVGGREELAIGGESGQMVSQQSTTRMCEPAPTVQCTLCTSVHQCTVCTTV